jgi:hypothetical protein
MSREKARHNYIVESIMHRMEGRKPEKPVCFCGKPAMHDSAFLCHDCYDIEVKMVQELGKS